MAERETEISQAFKRAAELRETPIRQAFVRGARDGIRRMVQVLWDEREGKKGYRRCLMALNSTEAAALRNRHPTYYRDRFAKPPVDAVSFPASCHDLWIREDRLEYV